MSIADLRRDYQLGTLDRNDLLADPMEQFQRWFQDAEHTKVSGGWLRKISIAFYKFLQVLVGRDSVEPNAMTLATVDADGHPSARIVLLKGIDYRGFIFFTNYESRKGQELRINPAAALVFYWSELERQVCISGTVTKLPREESEKYFKSRPRGSQLAAWASNQSDVLPNSEVLKKKWQQVADRFSGKEVPLPDFWGGYVLDPIRIELWQGRPSRMHDRFRYSRQPDGRWALERLSP